MAAPHTRGPAVRPDHLAGHEAFDQVGAGLGGRLDQQRVEDGPPRAVGVGRASHRRPGAGYLHRAGVEGDLADGRAAAGAQPTEQVQNLLVKLGVWEKFRPGSKAGPKPGERKAAES